MVIYSVINQKKHGTDNSPLETRERVNLGNCGFFISKFLISTHSNENTMHEILALSQPKEEIYK